MNKAKDLDGRIVPPLLNVTCTTMLIGREFLFICQLLAYSSRRVVDIWHREGAYLVFRAHPSSRTWED